MPPVAESSVTVDSPVVASSRFSHVTERLVPFLLLVCMFVLCLFPTLDHDLWWHLRTGRLIWQEKAIPTVDRFLFTDYDRPWVDLHWGYQLFVAALYEIGGVNLILVVKAVILTAAVGLAWRAAGWGLPAWVRALVWCPALVCISGRAFERPEILSQAFLVAWLWMATNVERRPKWIWFLPVLQVVWINCHALFVLGLVVGACYAVDRVVREICGGRIGLEPPPPEPPLRSVMWAGILCGLAALCNPYFEEGALFPLELYRKFTVDQHFWKDVAGIGEFQRPLDLLWKNGKSGRLEFDPRGLTNLYLLSQILVLLTCLASFIALAAKRRWSPFRLLIFVAFTHLGWKATRNVNIFAFSLTVVSVANFADFARLRRERAPAPFPAPFRLPGGANAWTAAALALWAVTIVAGPWYQLGDDGRHFGFGERKQWFGHDAVKFAGQPGFPNHAIIGHVGIAGVYEFHHGPERRVYADPRLEVITKETFQNYLNLASMIAAGDRRWEPTLRDNEGRLPVLIFDSRYSLLQVAGLLSTPGWRMVYADHSAAVFLETPLAEKLGLKAVSPAALRNPP